MSIRITGIASFEVNSQSLTPVFCPPPCLMFCEPGMDLLHEEGVNVVDENKKWAVKVRAFAAEMKVGNSFCKYTFEVLENLDPLQVTGVIARVSQLGPEVVKGLYVSSYRP